MIRMYIATTGGGKTSLATALGIKKMLDPLPLINYENDSNILQSLGLKRPNLQHLVASNFLIKGYFANSYDFDPEKFKITCDDNNINLPFGLSIFIDEAQNYFDSDSKLSREKSRAFEVSRHGKLDIYLLTHRPLKIHKTIRSLTKEFYFILNVDVLKDEVERIVKIIWTTRMLTNNADVEYYLQVPEDKRTKVGKIVKFEFAGNIYDHYDSDYYRYLFTNPKKQKFDFSESQIKINNEEDLMNFIKNNKVGGN